MRMALDREAPRRMAKKKIRGTDYGEDAEKMLEDGARALEAKDTEQVEIRSADGIRLVGHWYPAKNAKRVIIAMHGWRSRWSRDFGTIADFWHDNGCHILFAEQRGQNNSEGDYMGFGILERHDCREWAWWVSKHHGEALPIYLAGISMGATTVLMASSRRSCGAGGYVHGETGLTDTGTGADKYHVSLTHTDQQFIDNSESRGNTCRALGVILDLLEVLVVGSQNVKYMAEISGGLLLGEGVYLCFGFFQNGGGGVHLG